MLLKKKKHVKDKELSRRKMEKLNTLCFPFHLLANHDLHKLLVVYLAIAIKIGLPDHLIHPLPELCCRDEHILVLVKDCECLLELHPGIGVFHLPNHQVDQLQEVMVPLPSALPHRPGVEPQWGYIPKRPHHRSKYLSNSEK
ncbi:hypothetical protein SAY87_017664 [Trapa incisa]|uniref:Uncharacterized protein n=1 Tax=Trapa incisa TaxID=236973 RepID=A0AAN7L155_9MYRT|nr:hypothetical protein SAY87_017664 [Trapa incisa]